jgi:tetratricopeptide (TPR) repeat protein
MDQGQLADAERLLRNALAICTKRGDQGLPARIVASGNLALALIDRAKYTEADSLTFPAVEEAAAMFGSKSNQYVTLLCIRGSIAMGRDNLPQAIKLLQRAIAIMESKRPDGEELGRAYQNLAAAAAQAGKMKLALASLRRARHTWLSALPEDHPALIDEQNTLMCIYLRTQQYQKAYAVTMSILPRAEKILGPDHPRFAVILSNAAMIYEHETREAEAADAFHRAYKINLHALGSMHPNTAYALLGYGRTIAKDGQPAQGASFQRQATALLNTLH